jgi:hypothetical protein
MQLAAHPESDARADAGQQRQTNDNQHESWDYGDKAAYYSEDYENYPSNSINNSQPQRSVARALLVGHLL